MNTAEAAVNAALREMGDVVPAVPTHGQEMAEGVMAEADSGPS